MARSCRDICSVAVTKDNVSERLSSRMHGINGIQERTMILPNSLILNHKILLLKSCKIYVLPPCPPSNNGFNHLHCKPPRQLKTRIASVDHDPSMSLIGRISSSSLSIGIAAPSHSASKNQDSSSHSLRIKQTREQQIPRKQC